MRQLTRVLQRELLSRFNSRFVMTGLLIFPMLASGMAFYLGHFYERNLATLTAFFAFHPWLYLVLVPALTMGVWVEERQSGSIELLTTLPVSTFKVVTGKFLSTWLVAGTALVLTAPMVWTVNYLGSPDAGLIIGGYLGSWLLAGMFLAVGGCISAFMNSPFSAYIVVLVVCFLMLASGLPQVLQSMSAFLDIETVYTIAELSPLTIFENVSQGLSKANDVMLAMNVIVGSLVIASVTVQCRSVE